jgi:PhoPQ-activated pathogenicity-related protein
MKNPNEFLIDLSAGHILNMTSQRWLTDADFSESSDAKSIWWHWLVVIVPDELKFTRNASMWITGGGMGSSPPVADSEDILVSAALACSVGSITGVLYQVECSEQYDLSRSYLCPITQIPNEHITFASDPIQKSRTEDAIIAYTWDHFLNDPSQPEWLVRFPMVKASVRAMDAMNEFVTQELPQLGAQLDYFSISGASKRGWTTWLVGAVDPKRVMAIAPVVLDAVNFVAVEHHEFRSYGGWSYALQDYIDMHLTTRFDDPNMILLQQNEDPYFYFDRLTMPKVPSLLSSATDGSSDGCQRRRR